MGRTKWQFVVLDTGATPSESGPVPRTVTVVGEGLDNSEDARRWLKEHGKEGRIYQIAALTGSPIIVHEELITRRKVVNASPVTADGPDPRD